MNDALKLAEDMESEQFPIGERSQLPVRMFAEIKPIIGDDEFLVERLLSMNAMSVIYGESNSGKSFFTLDLALHIAQGKEWFGRTTRQGAVAYVAAEAGNSMLNRVAAYKQEKDLDDADLPFAVIPACVDLLAPDGDTDGLIAAINQVKGRAGEDPVFVVIDTLARAFGGGNENQPQDMGNFVRNIDRIRVETGAHVCVVHHSGKDSAKGARGHSSLRAATDTEIEISNHTARATKQRDMPIEEPIGFALVPVVIATDANGTEITSCVVESRLVMPDEWARKLNPRALQALESLRSLEPIAQEVAVEGQKRQVISLELWKKRFLDTHYADKGKSTKSQAFGRASDELIKKGHVNRHEDFVWRVGSEAGGFT